MLYLFLLVGIHLVDGFGLPEKMHGKWEPSSIPHAMLGPNHYIRDFLAVKDDKHGSSWFQLIDGQEFMVSDSTNEMQYCFSTPLPVSETSPFYQHYVDENKIDFCWRGEPMNIHAAGCQACECAKITLELKSDDVLHATFWMSPPVIHMHAEFYRRGPPPSLASLKAWLGGKRCTYLNRTGLLPYTSTSPGLSMCPSLRKIHKQQQQPQLQLEERLQVQEGAHKCLKLNGINYLMDSVNVPNIRFQFKKPRLSCWPCDVQYSVSANVRDDQYLGVGFKGMGYGIGFNDKKVRPNYFGMGHDDLDEVRGGSAIAVGHGTCLREMKVLNYTGAPIDLLAGDFRVAASGSLQFDGYYVQNGEMNGKPRFRKVGGKQTCHYGDGFWYLAEDYNGEWYRAPAKRKSDVPPESGWSVEESSLGKQPAPCVSQDSGEARQLKQGSAERINGRVIIRFTMRQYVGRDPASIDDFFADPIQGSVRVMWAIGDVANEEDCSTPLKYHNLVRGVAPLKWLSINSLGCDYSDYEMDSKGPAPPPTPPGPPPSPLPFWPPAPSPPSPPAPPTPDAGDSWVCSVCSHVYAPEADGAGVAFEDLPDSWVCPVCAQPKSAYNKQPVPTPPPVPTPNTGESWVCSVCLHEYDPEADGAGAAFEDLPDSWVCPVCAQPKSVYDKQSKVLLL